MHVNSVFGGRVVKKGREVAMLLNGMLVRLALAAGLLLIPVSTQAGDCKEHIELHDAKRWARELGRSEMWVLANHQINLWQNPSPNKGSKVGEMRVGSRALILHVSKNDYRVKSPLDSSIGWVSKIQVARTVWQHTQTFKACNPPK